MALRSRRSYRPRPTLLLLAVSSLASSVAAAPQSLLADVNQAQPVEAPASQPGSIAFLGSMTICAGEVPGLGRELCWSDGTPGGGGLLFDVNPGPASSDPSELVVLDGVAYFTAFRAGDGPAVWRSDGTPEGTWMLIDTWPGSGYAYPEQLVVSDELLYFASLDGANNNYEVYRSDGTPEGTYAITNLSHGSEPRDMVTVGDRLYFRVIWSADSQLWTSTGSSANTVPGSLGLYPYGMTPFGSDVAFISGVFGSNEVWKSDGTSASQVSDLLPGGSFPSNLRAWNGSLYFAARDANSDVELYRSEGTPATTVLVADLDPAASSNPEDLVAGAQHLWFTAETAATGRELYRSDGTAAGTVAVGEIVPGAEEPGIQWMTALADGVAFAASAASGERELWFADAAGVGLLADVNANGSSFPDGLTTDAAGLLWFAADDGVHGRELWTSDGSGAGTQLAGDLFPFPLSAASNPRELVETLGRVFFLADDGVHGEELWVTDGTEAGTHLVLDIMPGPTSSGPEGLTAFQGRVYFSADPSADGFNNNRELWMSDGTAAGTQQVADLNPFGSSFPEDITATDQHVYFSAQTFDLGREPYSTDGTTTVLLGDLETNTILKSSDPSEFLQAGPHVYFRAETFASGWELYRTDGTPQGTFLMDLHPGPNDSFPLHFEVWGERLLFVASAAEQGREPWITDGTPQGTFVLADLEPGSAGSDPLEFTAVGERVYFSAETLGLGRELYVTDGSPAGTELFFEFQAGADDSDIGDLLALGDQLLFTVEGFITRSLYATDGTPEGTEPLLLLNPANPWLGVVPGLTRAGPLAYFQVFLNQDDHRLWRSDGTPEGTFQVEFANQPGDVWTQELTAAGDGGELLFRGRLPESGNELWLADGSAGGTNLFADLVPGSGESFPSDFVRLEGAFLFAADDPERGRELFRVSLGDLGGYAIEPFGLGCSGSSGLTPAIAGQGVARLGETVQIELSEAATNSVAFLYYSPQRAAFELAPGCTLYYGAPSLLLGSPPTDGFGQAAFPVPIPSVSSLVGSAQFFQYAVFDPGAAFLDLVSLTGGLEVVVGP